MDGLIQQMSELRNIDQELLTKEAELLNWLIKTKSIALEDEFGFLSSFSVFFSSTFTY